MPELPTTDLNDDDYALRVLPEKGLDDDSESLPFGSSPDGVILESTTAPVDFTVEPTGEPQTTGTKFYVREATSGARFYAGKLTRYGRYRGLYRSSTLLQYDRFTEEARMGDWAHFIWPTVMAESNGRYITINAWDRAHFTWGFYQLAAHTARDNLILLMRELLKLPLAEKYFPDLVLLDGKVTQKVGGGLINLEKEKSVDVGSWTETQIPRFMVYLNPSSKRLDNAEVITAAKFATWAQEDPLMRQTTVDVSISIMKGKLQRLAARFGLEGRRPELAIWVSDMYHHGRGSSSKVRAALQLNTFEKQLDALSKIDKTGQHKARLRNVKRRVDQLLAEDRFTNATLGDATLPL